MSEATAYPELPGRPGVTLVTSDLLQRLSGVVHGFTTREGGTSQGPFATLNLSTRVGDVRSVVESNRRQVLTWLGRSDATLVTLRQVHGNEIVQVNRQAGRSIEADGVWTIDPQVVVSVLVADCVPLVMTDTAGTMVAAVHAGWRGTRLRIASRMTKRLVAHGATMSQLRVAIGPAIGPCCFEIGNDVAEALREAYPQAGEAVRLTAGGKLCADLWSLNVADLVEAGVPREHIDVLRTCTSCSPAFFSHRRDQGTTGRQAGVIGMALPK